MAGSRVTISGRLGRLDGAIASWPADPKEYPLSAWTGARPVSAIVFVKHFREQGIGRPDEKLPLIPQRRRDSVVVRDWR
jgi:hypothetical protein